MEVGIKDIRARVWVGTSVVVALVGAFAAPADAAVTGHQGAMDHTLVVNCTSVELGSPTTEWGMTLVAGAAYDDAVPLKVGDVFYAGVYVAAVGNPCPTQSFYPDLTLPAGISAAVSAASPIQCWHEDFSGATTVETRDTTHCPAAVGAPEAGGTVGLPSHGLSGSGAWPIPQGEGYEIDVPLVATRAYAGPISFPTQTIDGNLNQIWAPDVTVDVVAGSTPPPPPVSPTCTVTWRSTKVLSSRVAATVACTQAVATATYAKLTIALGGHRTTSARTAVVRTPVNAGHPATVRLRLPAAALAALRDRRVVTARAYSTGTNTAGTSSVHTAIHRLTR